ncbi:hypothetical protein [Streptomyces sp. NPDC091217]|uniref:hypothetical protein n=1 Tax=Streptomyces sp. NPDC091217 TaxID=3365975 RepID=UPI0038278BA3
MAAVPLGSIHELIMHPQFAPPAWTRQDDRLRLAKGFGTRPEQLARDDHRVEHLDSALTQQPLHSGHPAITRQQRPTLVDERLKPSSPLRMQPIEGL